MSSLQNIANYTSSFFSKVPQDTLISNSSLIRIGDILQGFQSNQTIDIPNITVVGTQSSGKSSVLNSLIGMDILPTGKQMVTRTPLKIEIIRSYNDAEETTIQIGEYRESNWDPSLNEVIHFPNPTEQEKDKIMATILNETIKKAGGQRDVSNNMIFIKIKSPKVVNLSVIDLPGLTAVACTDQGQPSNIKTKIEELIMEYAGKKNSLILAILPGRSDLEADYGLEFVKKMDPNGLRTIGVLTKLDLMNDEHDITRYLNNSVSKDLQLKHGYFAVRNRNNIEKKTLDIQEGLEKEEKYFSNHSIFKQEKYRTRTGHHALRKHLSNLLAENIKTKLPSIQIEVDKQLQQVKEELREMGSPIPETSEGKISFVQNMIFNLCNDFNHHILKSASTARNLRSIFVEFRKKIKENNYYRKGNLTDEELKGIIENTEGNHMNFPFPPVDVIETCLQDKEKRPIYQFYDIIKECNLAVTNELIKLVDVILSHSPIFRFHLLKDLIRSESTGNIILHYSSKCDEQLKLQVNIQESYIWTDNTNFVDQLDKIQEKNINIISSIKNLLTIYIDSISEHLNDIIPKTIMYNLIHNSINTLYSHLNSCILKADIEKLLIEDNEIENRRKYLETTEKELIHIQKELMYLNSK